MDDTAQPDLFGFLHIDLNSFFASVEQQLHPEHRNKPLGVTATMADTGTLIAASYEAKALGIKTGTKVAEARRLCPHIVLLASDHSIYADYSHRITTAVDKVCPVSHNPSIDEMVCQLMGRERQPPNARRIALDIKQSIRDNVGETLRCSIGMAPNRYLAKIASDMQKPDGLIGLLPSQLPRAIAHLELRDLPGVGARTEQRLNTKGITTMPQLLALDRNGMHKLWDSVWGDRLYHWLRGHDTGDDGAPVPSEIQKSLGHSHVLAPEHRTPAGAWAVAHKLLHKAAMRLRMEHFYTASMAVTIRYSLTRDQVDDLQEIDVPSSMHLGAPSSPTASSSAKVGSQDFSFTYDVSSRPERSAVERPASASAHAGPQPNKRPKIKKHSSGITQTGWGMEARFAACQDTLSLLQALQGCWKHAPNAPEHQRPFFVGVTLTRLIPESEYQAPLFEDPGNRKELSTTMDKLNLKYGHSTLHFAGMLPARDSAPTRIAFTQIPVQYGNEWM
ncbi:DNA polymerase [Granulicella sp. 5B5]|uniref:DNA polymerase Y family protein n=1 Tax=Granulicella sp. 5B5 TaxID=1617967 RepID=UPI0015F3AFEB|nr:DNA polymerase [Granulicella sp. 5B5]QMV18577.1 DNA polymerase [Granulicella sp. 5B5]